MLMDVICLTMLAGECRSSRRLWIRISYRSYVLVPSPQGLLRVVMRRVLVGSRTGPETLSSFCRAPFFKSAHTFSSDLTLVDVRVMRMRWICDAASLDGNALALES